MKNIKLLIQQIVTGSWEQKLQASDELIQKNNDFVLTKLIGLLDANDPNIRNAAALALREIASPKAMIPLLDAIFNKDNLNNRSTLVYALENLDCSKHFIEIWKLACADKADVVVSALSILETQEFEVSEKMVEKAAFLLTSAQPGIQPDLRDILNRIS